MNDDLPRILRKNEVTAVKPLSRSPEPFNEISVFDLINTYADNAFAEKSTGAKIFLLPDFASLAQARSAVLGIRQTGLPVCLSMYLTDNGETVDSTDPLAALICLQELGLSAFGVGGSREVVREQLERLYPYAKIPLFSNPENIGEASDLLASCADILDVTRLDSGEAGRIADMAEAAAKLQKPPRPEDSPLLLADESQVYYLEEDFTVADVDCEQDIAGQIITAEDEGVDALLFHITCHEDVESFAADAYMSRCAVSFLAESEELLELALVSYTGRAMIDSRSGLDDDAMEVLARGYGAIIR